MRRTCMLYSYFCSCFGAEELFSGESILTTLIQNGRVSPRTSSQHSIKSGGAHSDKASKASASPLSDAMNIGDQPSLASITTPTPPLGGMPPPTAAEKRTSAQEASMESHNAKVARMEAPPNAVMGMGGGIPAAIEEESGYGT
jgi:hypothetical protein